MQLIKAAGDTVGVQVKQKRACSRFYFVRVVLKPIVDQKITPAESGPDLIGKKYFLLERA